MRVPNMARTCASGDSEGACSVNRARALSSASSVTSRLRDSLAETARLLDELERQETRQQLGNPPDVETYKGCCSRLVTYMVAHMDTSPHFAQQMDQVIEASYNDAGDFTLRASAPEDLWVRCAVTSNTSTQTTGFDGAGAHNTAVPCTPSPQGPTIKRDMGVGGAVTVTPLSVARAHAAVTIPTCSPHVDLTVSTPYTVGRGGKRQSRRSGVVSRQEIKRARHTVARNLYGAGRLDCDEKEEEEEENELESTTELETETETEAETEACGEQEVVQSTSATQLQEASSGGGVIWPCAGDDPLDRSPAFKQRLKNAIKLVDAENCCPPPGTACTQECVRIRTRMCETHRAQGGNAMPCHNGMCCVWRDVETHVVRCQNTQCEFKNRVGLRQARHDIKQHELKLQTTNEKLLTAKAALHDVNRDAVGASVSALETKVKRLEEKCTKLEDSVGFHIERKRTFLADLNAIELRLGNEEVGGLPVFDSHYMKKRAR